MKSDALECEETSRFTPENKKLEPQVHNHNIRFR
jgi:hypothetical protein